MNIVGSVAWKRLLIVLGLCLALGAGVVACGGGGSSSSSESTTEEPAEETTEETSEEGEEEPAESVEVSQIVAGEQNFEMSKYCGEKPTSVGMIDGFGGNTWRVETRKMIENLAGECPSVTSFKYFDANLDPEKFNSTITSWAAQGVNVIVVFDDFGQAAVPAMKAATQQGVKVVTDNAIPGNAVVGQDITAAVVPDFDKGAKEWVEFIDEATKGMAHVAVGGGPAGNLFDTPAQEAVEAAIEELGAEVEVVENEPFVGNWEPAKTQQAVSALLQKFPELNALALTYMATSPSVNRAFEAAGKPLPTNVGQSSSMEVICEANEKRKTDPNFNIMSLDGSAQQAAIAFAKGMAAYQEIEAPELGPTDEPTVVAYVQYINTLKNELPPCKKNLPPGADLSTALTEAEVIEITK